jgi:hypothetical protein
MCASWNSALVKRRTVDELIGHIQRCSIMATHLDRQRLERILLGQHEFMQEVYGMLEQEQKHDDVIRAVVLTSRGKGPVEVRNPDPARIFSGGTIRSLCIKYRLRFLESGLFKGPLPNDAVHAIRMLERHAGGPIHAFRVMAPAERFKLCDSEVDPLLFVPLGDDRFYLVHKWGNDLSPFRVLLGLPVRTPVHLAATVLLVALAITLAIPTEWITAWQINRPLMFVWNALVMTSFTVFGWFAFFGQFSNENWNSRYFN